MFKHLIAVLSLGLTISYAQIQIPSISPSIEISQQIGLTTAVLNYSRPSLRGRKLFGKRGVLILDKKWRTGANATTTLSFTRDVEIEGKVLKQGSYALLTTPKEQSWIFHFYEDQKLPYTQYLDRQPILEITVPRQALNYSLETMSLHFESIGISKAKLVLQWDIYKAELSLELNDHHTILTNIESVLNGPSDFNYFQAALYLHETQTDLPKALEYIRKVTSKKSAKFFQVYREALILKDLKRDTEAIAAAERSKKLSELAGNDDLVRLSMHIIEDLSK